MAARLAGGSTAEDAPVDIPEASGFACHAEGMLGPHMAVYLPESRALQAYHDQHAAAHMPAVEGQGP